MMLWIALIAGAYLVGSVPFGVILGRLKGLDIRDHGSRNIGATNVARVLGRRLGVLCFGLDLAKGAAPVLLAGLAQGYYGRRGASDFGVAELWLWLAVACAAVVGHMSSVFLRFRGGKGVASGFGAMVVMWPVLTLPALGAMVVWYIVLRASRYVSLASMTAAASIPLWYLVSALPNDALEQPLAHTVSRLAGAWPPLVVTSALALLILYRHRANIARLRRGEEPRVAARVRRGDLLRAPPPEKDK